MTDTGSLLSSDYHTAIKLRDVDKLRSAVANNVIQTINTVDQARGSATTQSLLLFISFSS